MNVKPGVNASLIFMAGGIVLAGRMSQKKPIDLPAVISLFFLAVMISILSEINEDIGRGFAILVLVSVVYVYGRDLANVASKAAKR
jgi:hypothetical protein